MLSGRGPLPWLLPAILVALVVGTAASGAVARVLGTRRIVGWVLLVSLGVILAATLTPLRGAFAGTLGSGTCDFSRLALPSIDDLLQPDDTALNILIFIPLGAAIGILPGSRRKTGILAAAIALPFAIEASQLLVTALDRACQSGDLVDNLTGLGIGLAAGVTVGWLVPGLGRPGDRPAPSPTT
jgi:glycopeptide antibiotics resistance protein